MMYPQDTTQVLEVLPAMIAFSRKINDYSIPVGWPSMLGNVRWSFTY